MRPVRRPPAAAAAPETRTLRAVSPHACQQPAHAFTACVDAAELACSLRRVPAVRWFVKPALTEWQPRPRHLQPPSPPPSCDNVVFDPPALTSRLNSQICTANRVHGAMRATCVCGACVCVQARPGGAQAPLAPRAHQPPLVTPWHAVQPPHGIYLPSTLSPRTPAGGASRQGNARAGDQCHYAPARRKQPDRGRRHFQHHRHCAQQGHGVVEV